MLVGVELQKSVQEDLFLLLQEIHAFTKVKLFKKKKTFGCSCFNFCLAPTFGKKRKTIFYNHLLWTVIKVFDHCVNRKMGIP